MAKKAWVRPRRWESRPTGLPDGIIVLYMCHGFSGVKPGWIVKVAHHCAHHTNEGWGGWMDAPRGTWLLIEWRGGASKEGGLLWKI